MSDNAPNVPQLPDSGHARWSPFEVIKQVLPGSKKAGTFEIGFNFAERIAVTLGVIASQQQDTAKVLEKLNMMVVAWTDPPMKNEWVYLAPNTNDNINMNTEAGERWILARVIAIPADGNPAHLPDTLFITNGLAGLMRLPIPNGSTTLDQPLNTPVHINIAQTSASSYPSIVICQFRREFRYEDDAWTSNSK